MRARRSRRGGPGPGDRVGAYEIVERVGSRGADLVYRARRGSRLYHLRIARRRPRAIEVVDREMAVLRRVRHPGVVRVRAGGWWPDPGRGRPYLVTDAVEGEPLAAWLARRRPSFATACEVLEKVARALAHLHEEGVHEAELGGEGVLVRAGGEPVLADPCAARTRSARREGGGLGALCALVHAALAGGPSPGDPRRGALAVDRRAASALEDLVPWLRERDPRRRPASAREVAEALARAREAAARADERPPAATASPAARVEEATLPGAHPRVDALPGAAPPGTPPPPPAGAPFDPPTGAALAFDDGPAPAEAPRGGATGTPTAIREVRARLAASGPRRTPVPARLASAGAAVVLASAVAALSAGRCGVARSARAAPAPDPVLAPAAHLPGPDALEGSPRPPPPDARAIDEDLEREFGRPTVMPDGGIEGGRPGAGATAVAPAAEERPWIKRSQRAERSAAPAPRGVPVGLHIRARLVTGLDSRVAGGGPVEAVLPGPAVVRGVAVLPPGTLAFGTATEGGGRFTVRFTRLRLPDDSEVAFEGVAVSRGDGRPGLPAALSVEREGDRGEGAAARLARGATGTLLDVLAGGLAHGVARNLGEAVAAREPAAAIPPSRTLLLDAGVLFDIWVERSF